MKKTDLLYAAGLIDGEGTITLVRHSRKEMKSPAVSVSSTSLELLEFMKETFGGHIIKLKAPKKKHWKQAWHWQTSHDRAISVIEHVLPFLKEQKKRARASLILKEYKKVTPRNGFYTPELLTARALFEDRFFSVS